MKVVKTLKTWRTLIPAATRIQLLILTCKHNLSYTKKCIKHFVFSSNIRKSGRRRQAPQHHAFELLAEQNDKIVKISEEGLELDKRNSKEDLKVKASMRGYIKKVTESQDIKKKRLEVQLELDKMKLKLLQQKFGEYNSANALSASSFSVPESISDFSTQRSFAFEVQEGATLCSQTDEPPSLQKIGRLI
jgi:hypothetical protein